MVRLERLDLGAQDTITIVDNRPASEPPIEPAPAGARLLRVTSPQSSYVARNRGAAVGSAPWLVFLDADITPHPHLLAALFEPAPAERTGVLAGAVRDDAGGEGTVAARTADHVSLDQANTLEREKWSYAQTVNCAVRRGAFVEVGGFEEGIRSGGDADICFRLGARGWGIEARDRAIVDHFTRATLRKLAGQRARHGAGATWLNRRYPGAFPREASLGKAKWAATSAVAAARAFLAGDRDRAAADLIAPTAFWAFELGRLLPNRPPRRSSWGLLGRWLR
ncbi:MAG: glycosyl transferase family 2 [Solirubrobacteraceae bacterium]|nr:glycosyl transferase family 2 [Solirubrobacteraceae bacterium]